MVHVVSESRSEGPQSESFTHLTHLPEPSQTLSPGTTKQAVPIAAGRVEHCPPSHTARTQGACDAGQSLDVSQGGHWPMAPSQALPLFVQAVLARTTSQTLHVRPMEEGRTFMVGTSMWAISRGLHVHAKERVNPYLRASMLK